MAFLNDLTAHQKICKMNNTITLEKAVQMTALFRAQKDTLLSTNFQGKNLLPICESFGREIFDHLLSQP